MEKIHLQSGVTLLIDPVPGSEVVSVGLWLNRGSRDEGPDERGYTHFTEHMLFKGTRKRNALDIALEIDEMGADINGATGHEHTSFFVNSARIFLDRAVEILADMYLNSIFDRSEFDKEKLVILGEIGMSMDDPEDYVNQMFSRLIWPGHGLGTPVMGREADVRSVTLEGIRTFYRECYGTDRLILSAAGGLDPDKFAKAAEKWFPDSRETPRYPRKKPAPGSGCLTECREIEHVYFLCGTEAYGYGDERRYQLLLLNMVLGSSLSSRLFQRIREDRGLCYAISSMASSFSDSGEFTINFSASPENLRPVLDELNKQIGLVMRSGIEEEELDRAKRRFFGNYTLARESVEWKMTRMAVQEMVFGRIFHYDEIMEKINRVTVSQIHAVARDLFHAPDFCFASLGPDAQNGVLDDFNFDFG